MIEEIEKPPALEADALRIEPLSVPLSVVEKE